MMNISRLTKSNESVFVITITNYFCDKKIEYDPSLLYAKTQEDAILAMVSISENVRIQIKDEWTFSESTLSECKTSVVIYYKKLGRFINGPLRIAFEISCKEANLLELKENKNIPPSLPPRGAIVEESLITSLHMNPKCDKCRKYHDVMVDCMVINDVSGYKEISYDALYWGEYPKIVYESQKNSSDIIMPLLYESQENTTELLCISDTGQEVLLHNEYNPSEEYIYRGEYIEPVDLPQVPYDEFKERFEERFEENFKERFEEKLKIEEQSEYTGGEPYVPETEELKKSIKIPRSFSWF